MVFIYKITFNSNIKCNFQCKYCSKYSNFSDLESVKELNKINKSIDFLDKNLVSKVKIIAGEPLLFFDEVKKIIKKCNKKEIEFEVVTNGSTVSNKVIDFFSENNIKNIIISFDSINHSENSYLRGDLFNKEKLFKIINYIEHKKYHIDIEINIVITSKNINSTEKTIIELKKMGIKKVNLLTLHNINDNYKFLHVSDTEMFKLIKSLYLLVKKESEYSGFITYNYKDQSNGCSYLSKKITINNKNIIKPCEKNLLKNIYLNKSLTEILKTNKKLRLKITECINNCPHDCLVESRTIYKDDSIDQKYNIVKNFHRQELENKISKEELYYSLKLINNCLTKNQYSSLTKKFEKDLKCLLDEKNIITTTSATSAIYTLIKFLDLKKSDEIIVHPWAHISSLKPIKEFGAKLIFPEIDQWGRMSFESIKSKITKNTKAIFLVHQDNYSCCSIEKLKEIKRNKKIIIIEDACRVFGAIDPKSHKHYGTLFDFGIFSLGQYKALNPHSGGVLFAKNTYDFEKISKYISESSGLNIRLDDLRSALGISLLRNFNNKINIKRRSAKRIYELLSKFSFIKLYNHTNIENGNNLILSFRTKNAKICNFLKKELTKKGILITNINFKKKLELIDLFCNDKNTKKTIKENLKKFSSCIIDLFIPNTTSNDYISKLQDALTITMMNFNEI